MIILDGQATSKKRLAALKERVDLEFKRTQKRPGLAVLRIGDDPASKIYVGRKLKACEASGIISVETHLPHTASEAEVISQIKRLNEDPAIHGILVQLPLPKQISEKNILNAVNPAKDVDGFHPMNLGKLMAGESAFVACTPLGIMTLLAEYKIELKGKRAAVIGRSRIVGRPMSLLLDHAGATVTVIHSQTKNPEEICKQADIVVAAVGKPKLVTPNWIKPGAVVVDVGINRLSDGKIVGDVDFEAVSKIASALTPVPGGVGPMTIASLLENTWTSFTS